MRLGDRGRLWSPGIDNPPRLLALLLEAIEGHSTFDPAGKKSPDAGVRSTTARSRVRWWRGTPIAVPDGICVVRVVPQHDTPTSVSARLDSRGEPSGGLRDVRRARGP